MLDPDRKERGMMSTARDTQLIARRLPVFGRRKFLKSRFRVLAVRRP